MAKRKGRGLVTLATLLAHTRIFQSVSLNAKILGEVETTVESRFAVMWDDSTLGLLFLFLLLYRHIWKIYVYPCFYQSPLSNLYLTLYFVQVGIFKEIQHYRYSCCLMCIPLCSHFFLPSIETTTILNLLIIFKLFLFCSYMHVYECIKYIALFHMLTILKIYTLFYMYTYNTQIILKHFFFVQN